MCVGRVKPQRRIAPGGFLEAHPLGRLARRLPLTLEEFDAARLSEDAILASAHMPVVQQT